MAHPTYSPASGHFHAPRSVRRLDATLALPGSKSLTNRELVLAALASGPGKLFSPLHSDDTARMIGALTVLGVGVGDTHSQGEFGPDLFVTPLTAEGTGGDVTINAGQAGTVMRFVSPLAALTKADVTITASAEALHRPMGPLIGALRGLGVEIDDHGTGKMPFRIHGTGHVRGGKVEIDASASSQLVSALLLSAARFDEGLHLVHRGERLPSLPHIEMTIATLAHRGVQVQQPSPGEWIVEPQEILAADVAIEPDLSNAAPFLAAALVAGGSVTIQGWPTTSTQPGFHLPELFGRIGADVRVGPGSLTVASGDLIEGGALDLGAVGELTPTFVGLAAFADRATTFSGIGHLRWHETNRIAALVNNLRALGGTAEELADGLTVVPSSLHKGLWAAEHDHRIATTGALIGLRVRGVIIDDIGTTAKTLPEFTALWERMLG